MDPKELLNKEEYRIFTGNLKRSPTAYALFVKSVHGEYKDMNMKNGSVLKAIAQQWKDLDADTKAEFERRAAEVSSER